MTHLQGGRNNTEQRSGEEDRIATQGPRASDAQALHRAQLTGSRCGHPFFDQTTFDEVITSLGDLTVSYTFTMTPLGPVILSYSPPIAYVLIEYATESKPDGQMTEDQCSAMNQVFKLDLADIEAMWSPVVEVKGEDAEVETNPDSLASVLERSTCVNLLAFEVHFPHANGLVEISNPLDETLGSIAPELA